MPLVESVTLLLSWRGEDDIAGFAVKLQGAAGGEDNLIHVGLVFEADNHDSPAGCRRGFCGHSKCSPGIPDEAAFGDDDVGHAFTICISS